MGVCVSVCVCLFVHLFIGFFIDSLSTHFLSPGVSVVCLVPEIAHDSDAPHADSTRLHAHACPFLALLSRSLVCDSRRCDSSLRLFLCVCCSIMHIIIMTARGERLQMARLVFDVPHQRGPLDMQNADQLLHWPRVFLGKLRHQ